jgi:hypothetical protein
MSTTFVTNDGMGGDPDSPDKVNAVPCRPRRRTRHEQRVAAAWPAPRGRQQLPRQPSARPLSCGATARQNPAASAARARVPIRDTPASAGAAPAPTRCFPRGRRRGSMPSSRQPTPRTRAAPRPRPPTCSAPPRSPWATRRCRRRARASPCCTPPTALLHTSAADTSSRPRPPLPALRVVLRGGGREGPSPRPLPARAPLASRVLAPAPAPAQGAETAPPARRSTAGLQDGAEEHWNLIMKKLAPQGYKKSPAWQKAPRSFRTRAHSLLPKRHVSQCRYSASLSA